MWPIHCWPNPKCFKFHGGNASGGTRNRSPSLGPIMVIVDNNRAEAELEIAVAKYHKFLSSYPEIVPLSALIACNAMNWLGGDALSFSHRFHHWLMLYTLGQYIVNVQSSTTSDGFLTIFIFGIMLYAVFGKKFWQTIDKQPLLELPLQEYLTIDTGARRNWQPPCGYPMSATACIYIVIYSWHTHSWHTPPHGPKFSQFHAVFWKTW